MWRGGLQSLIQLLCDSLLHDWCEGLVHDSILERLSGIHPHNLRRLTLPLPVLFLPQQLGLLTGE